MKIGSLLLQFLLSLLFALGPSVFIPDNANAGNSDYSSFARATTTVRFSGNLNFDAPILTIPLIPVISSVGNTNSTTTFAEALSNADLSVSVDVFDSLGSAHPVLLGFYHLGVGYWVVQVIAHGKDVDPVIPDGPDLDLPRLMGTGILSFDSSGAQVLNHLAPSAYSPWNNGANATIKTKFVFDDISQVASNSVILSVLQNGSGAKPSSESLTLKPRVAIKGKKGTLLMQRSLVSASYELTLSRDGRETTVRSSQNRVTLKNMKPGKWSARYKVVTNEGTNSISTLESRKTIFKVK